MAGIKVPGSFVPGTVKGYVTESKWVKGTYIVVQDLDEKELLPTDILVDGTRIYVASEDREYRWTSGDWVSLPKGFFDAPVDGRVYARQNGNWTEVKFDTTNIEQQIQDLYTQVSSKADANSVVSIQEFTAFQEQIEQELLNYVTQEELGSYTQMQIVQELPVTGNSDTIYFLSIDNHWEINIWYNNQYVTVTSSDIDLSNYYTKKEIDSLISNALAQKQDVLQSGVNIKTVNNQSLLGSGNIQLEVGDIAPATENTLGGLLSTDTSTSQGVSTYVEVQENGQAFVKVPPLSDITTSEEVAEILQPDTGYLILDGNN